MIGLKGIIGIFQGDHPIQIHTINLVRMLVQNGYHVDLFLLNPVFFVDCDTVFHEKNITVYIYCNNAIFDSLSKDADAGYFRIRDLPSDENSRIKKIEQRFVNFFIKSYVPVPGILPRAVIQDAETIVNNKRYVCLVGVEKKGLVWAGTVSDNKIPLIYYSLELYTHDHYRIRNSEKLKILKKHEEFYHKKAVATIVQDPLRAVILYFDNGVNIHEVTPLYLPVSVFKTGSVEPLPRDINDINNIKILYYGRISYERNIPQLIRVAQDFPSNWLLDIHSFEQNPVVSESKKHDERKKVLFSTQKLPDESLKKLIRDSDIGLVLYDSSSMNNILTAYSSEKLAVFLSEGIPVVGFNYPGYEIIRKSRSGVLVNGIDEIPRAIQEIIDNYRTMSENAYACFDEHYNYEKNFYTVLHFIKSLNPAD